MKARDHTVCLIAAALLVGCGATEGRSTRSLPAGTLGEVEVRRSAETAAGGELPVSPALEDYVRYALARSPVLEAAYRNWQAAMEQIPQASALPDPRLSYRYYLQEVETRVGPQDWAMGLSQTFPWFGKRGLRADIAAEEAAAAWYSFQARKAAVVRAVKDAYYELYYLKRAIRVTERARDLVEHLEAVARTRYSSGAVEHADVIRAQVELGTLEDQLHALRELHEPLAARLNAALNRPATAELRCALNIDDATLEAPPQRVVAALEELNPELLALGRQAESRARAVELAGKAFYPDITLGLDYIDTDSARMSGVRGSGEDPVIASVSINVPIWRASYRAGERQRRAQHRAALAERDQRANTLMARVKMVLFRYRDADRKAGLYRDTLLPKATQSLQATEAAYRAGKGSFLDLVEAERVLLEFELTRERAVTDRAQRLAELEMLLGGTLPVADVAAQEQVEGADE